VACGEASATSSTNSATTSSVTSVSSAYANVTSVNLSAASNLLTQTLGTLKTVTVTAVLNANTNPNLAVEWFVNGVKQQQTGRVLDYTPTAAGAFAVTARVGNVSSNVLTVNVGLPTINITKTEFVTSRQLALTADAGANVTVVGAKLEDSSYFDLKTGRYILNFESPVEQGTNLTVRLERPGFGVKVEQVLFDTRQFTTDTVELLTGSGLTLVNGTYQVTRPYDAGAQYAKVLEVTFNQKNILSTLKSQEFKVATVVPTGATAVAPSTTLITELGTQQITINSNTVLGLYTFTYELGGKTQVVRLQVNEAKPEIVTSEAFTDEEYFNTITGELIPFGVALETVVEGDEEEYTYVPTDSTGVFLVEKPFASTLNTKTLIVDFVARNFVADDFLDNQYTVNLFGPSANTSGITQLFAGIELEDTEAAGLNNDDLSTNNTFEAFNGQLLTTGGALRTSANGRVTQIIDRGTPVGDYTFTVTAGQPGKEITKDIKVRISEPKAEIIFDIQELVSENNVNERLHEIEVSGNTYTIEKPLVSELDLELNWVAMLVNYQSALETDLNKISQDIIQTDFSKRTLFSLSTGIKDSELHDIDSDSYDDFDDAHFLVGINTTNNQVKFDPIKAQLYGTEIENYVVILITDTADLAGFTSSAIKVADLYDDDLFVESDIKTLVNGEVIIDQELSVDNTIEPGQMLEYVILVNRTLGELNTLLDGYSPANVDELVDDLLGDSIDFSEDDDEIITVVASNYPDVIELGGGDLNGELYGEDDASYRFVQVGMSVTGPSRLFEPLPLTRTAILLGSGDNAYELVDQSDFEPQNENGLWGYLEDKYPQINDVDSSTAEYADLNYDDNFGFERDPLVINSETVAGTYTLTFTVDGLEKVVNIVIKNPQPKLFVLSGNFDNGNDRLFNRPVSDHLDGTTFATSGPLFNKIKFFDNDADFTDVEEVKDLLDHDTDELDLFATEVNGVYTIQLPQDYDLDADTYGLFSLIGVSELNKGTYNYRISKSYPSGRLETFSDTVSVTDIDDNGLAVFDVNNEKFIDNFIIAEVGLELGRYTFEFSVASVSKIVVIEVVEMPGFNVEKLTIGEFVATEYQNYQLIDIEVVEVLENEAMRVLIDVSRLGLLETDFFLITDVFGSGDYEAVLDDLDVGEFTIKNLIEIGVMESLDGLLLLDIGSIYGDVDLDETLTIEIEFYREVTHLEYLAALGYTTNGDFLGDIGDYDYPRFIQIGEEQSINIAFYSSNDYFAE
jgi:hypothetical protein